MKKVLSVMVSLMAVLMLCITGVGFAEDAEDTGKIDQEVQANQVAEEPAAAQPEQTADAEAAEKAPQAAKAEKECEHKANAGVEKDS